MKRLSGMILPAGLSCLATVTAGNAFLKKSCRRSINRGQALNFSACFGKLSTPSGRDLFCREETVYRKVTTTMIMTEGNSDEEDFP